MEKFTFKPFDSTQEPEVFTTDNGYVESSGEIDNRKQLSFPLKNIADYLNQIVVPQVENKEERVTKLESDLAAESNRAKEAEANISSSVANAVNDYNAKISEEASSRNSADLLLKDSISTVNDRVTSEITRAQNKESSLEASISAVNSDLTNAKTDLNSKITDETSRAKTAESSLSSAISSENTRATQAETSLAGSIATEKSRAETVENSIQSSLNAEVSRAKNAENNLQDNINKKQDQINYENMLDYKYIKNTPSQPVAEDWSMLFYLLSDNILFSCDDGEDPIYFGDENGNFVLCN